MWKATRGRRKRRVTPQAAQQFILHRRLPVRAGNRNKLQYRLAQSRALCAERCPWPPVPGKGPLIAIADAMVKYVERAWHTWYFILVRNPKADEAVVLPPFHRKGTETTNGWQEAFAAVDPAILSRIQALVSDGHCGLVYEARWRGWLLQRCHFHLIAAIQARRSRLKTSRHYAEGQRLHELVKRVLSEPDEAIVPSLINALEETGWHTPSRKLRGVLLGFANHYREFRTYLSRPELRLPITSNTAETLIGIVEEVLSRARGFKRVPVLNEWILCICKTRKAVRCRPHASTK